MAAAAENREEPVADASARARADISAGSASSESGMPASSASASAASASANMSGRMAKYPTKLRRNYPRSRNGCLTCRQRKKKCDETRPLCNACQRNCLSCLWPTIRSRPARELPAPPPASTEVPSSLDGLPTSTALALVRCNFLSGRPGDQSSGSQSSGSLFEYAGQADYENAENAENAENMENAETETDDSSSSVAHWPLTNTGFAFQPPPVPPIPPPLPLLHQQRAATLTPLSTAMLRCYIVHAAPTLSTAREAADNPFLAAVLPLAYTDDLVMHCVLALGGAHLGVLAFLDSRPSSGLWSGLSSGLPSGLDSGLSSYPSLSSSLDSCPVSLFGTSSSSSYSSPFAFGATSRSPSQADPPSLVALHEATTRHYTCVLRSLRTILQGGHLQPHDTAQVLRTLLVLLLLAIYESASWNVLDGGVLAHLRASRQLIAWLRGGAHNPKGRLPLAPPTATAEERAMLGALLEIYAYLVLVNRDFREDDGDDDDDNNNGAKEGGVEDDGELEDFVRSPGLLADQPYFGHRLVGLHDLFALILPVTRCARDMLTRRRRRTTGRDKRGGRSCSTLATVKALRRRTLAWQLDPVHLQHHATSDQEHVWWRAIGEVYRNALLTYLAVVEEKEKGRLADEDESGRAHPVHGVSGVNGAHADDDAESVEDMTDLDDADPASSHHNHTHIFEHHPFVGGVPAAFQETLHQYIHATGTATLDTNLASSRFISIMLWPLLVIGSILPHESARTYLVQGLRTVRPSSWAAVRAADLLEMLWKFRDEEAAEADAAAAAEAAAAEAEAAAAAEAAKKQSASRRSRDSHANSTQDRKRSRRQLPVYFGPSGLARLMREQNVRLCIY